MTLHLDANTASDIRWDLSDLFSSPQDPLIAKTLTQSAVRADTFVSTYKGNLSTLQASSLRLAYQELESILSPLYRVSQYVQLVYAIDTTDEFVKALVSSVEDSESDIFQKLVFFDLELGALPPDVYTSFIQNSELEPYRYSLEQSKKNAPYHLCEREEQLILLKNLTGSNAFQKLYNERTSSYQFEFELDGILKKMNGSELRALRQHPDSAVRQRAMSLFFKTYESDQVLLSHTYNAIVKDHAIEKKLRGYSSAIGVKNIGNDLSDTSVSILHEVTTRSYKLVQRYYRLKATLLQMPRLTLSDIYAPLPESTQSFTWDDAKTLVLDSFKSFDRDIYTMALGMFEEHRIDAPIALTKRGGAFCSSSVPALKPYVLLNFLGRSRDVSTLAHELGHAIHDMLCAHQPLVYYHPILPLAETASVFSEMLLTDHLLKKTQDPLSKQALLTDKLEDIFATSHRQNMFSRFEMRTHDTIATHFMSASELCQAYTEELCLLFGDSVDILPEYAWEWAAIPHIYESPFYVYAYNFGNLLVMSLYQLYLEKGPSFVPTYKAFLGMGSAASPAEITKMVHATIEDPSFWEKSLTYVDHLITQLEDTMA